MFDPASLQLLTVLNKEVSYRSSLHRAENKFTQVKRKLNLCTAESGCFLLEKSVGQKQLAF